MNRSQTASEKMNGRRHRHSWSINKQSDGKLRKDSLTMDVKAVKREINANTREDWIWPDSLPLPHTLRIDDETRWQPRTMDSSSPSPPSSTPDPYKFESPDSVAEESMAHKDKRRRLQIEEMRWNPGLRTFVERRNAWTGGGFGPASTQDNPVFESVMDVIGDSRTDIVELCPLPEPLIPSTNPVRASIGPAIYPSVYSRVVVQGTTPNIPINLADMTTALVEGWKMDGEWPPRGKDLEPLVGRRRNRQGAVALDSSGSLHSGIVKGSVGIVKRAFGLKHHKYPVDSCIEVVNDTEV